MWRCILAKVFGKSDDVDGDDDGCLWYNENLTFYGIKVDSALCYEENYGIGNFVFWFEYSNKSKLQEMLDEYCTYSNSYGDYRNFSCGDTEITVNYGDGSENIYVNIITY